MGRNSKFLLALIAPLPVNRLFNKVVSKVPNNIPRNLPFSSFASFLMFSLTPFINAQIIQEN